MGELYDDEVLRSLIDNEVSESRTLEYKSALPGNSSSDRKEFLADVSAMANTMGGSIFYGVTEENGIARRIGGVDILNFDELKLRLETCIITSIDPRIPSIDFRMVPLTNGKSVLVLTIPKSWAAPHMVTLEHSNRFFRRSNSGKYLMDTAELKAEFINAVAVPEKARQFRISRINAICSPNPPVDVWSGGRIAIHVIPLESLLRSISVSSEKLCAIAPNLRLFTSRHFHHRANLDGCLLRGTGRGEKECHSYIQLFRNGIIEAVSASAGRVYEVSDSGNQGTRVMYRWLNWDNIRASIVDIANQLSGYYETIQISGPVYLFLTFIGVKKVMLLTPNHAVFDDEDNHLRSFDRDLIPFSEVELTLPAAEIEKSLDALFADIWHASGYEVARGRY